MMKKSALSADDFFTKSTRELAQAALKRSVDEKKNKFKSPGPPIAAEGTGKSRYHLIFFDCFAVITYCKLKRHGAGIDASDKKRQAELRRKKIVITGVLVAVILLLLGVGITIYSITADHADSAP